jgi:hypothetical protein
MAPPKAPTRNLPRRAAYVWWLFFAHEHVKDIFFFQCLKETHRGNCHIRWRGWGTSFVQTQGSVSTTRSVFFIDDSTSNPCSRPQNSVKKEEIQLDRDISALLGNNSAAGTLSAQSYDSIMGPDSEEDADEVDDLLAEEWMYHLMFICNLYFTIMLNR